MQRPIVPGLRLTAGVHKVMMRALERVMPTRRGEMSLFGVVCMYPLSLLDGDPGDDDFEVLVM